jgi:sodium/bile acid cotransporter 7
MSTSAELPAHVPPQTSAGASHAAMKNPFDWFMGGLVAAVTLAWLLPHPGAHGGILHPEILTKAGVAVIFFLSGISLPFSALSHGMMQWRLHLTAQLCIFLLFPLLGLALYLATASLLGTEMRLGLFYLCALPSTVSSAVAMTSAAHGNVPVAILNAVLSSLLGVVLTPLWLSAVLHASGVELPIGPVIRGLVIWLVMPLAVGQLVRPWLGAWAQRNKAYLHIVDRSTILLIVYTSFCDAVVAGVWTRYGVGSVLVILFISAVLLALVLGLTMYLGFLQRFALPDRIAVTFIGSKKSLATGVPMAQLIFGASPAIGMILMPIMIYHPLQLVVCGILARRFANQVDLGGKPSAPLPQRSPTDP